MTCVKGCERESPELNFRPLGLDYGLPWLIPLQSQDKRNTSVSQVETNFWLGALLTTLQGSVLVHYMPKILSDLRLDPAFASAPPSFDFPFLAHATITAGLLALPGLLSLAVDKLSAPLENLLSSLERPGESLRETMERNTIISLYETMMKTDLPVQEMLQEFDPDGDGMVTGWECKQAFDHMHIPAAQGKTLLTLMQRRFGDVENIPIDSWFENFQELYAEARREESQLTRQENSSFNRLPIQNELLTKKTFVEIFNELDKDGDGFVSGDDFSALLDKSSLRRPLSEEQKLQLLQAVDPLKKEHWNLLEFMSAMRKIVRVGIQEIGYGYLPLAWASLTAYWLGIGMSELGLVLDRLPDTFFIEHSIPLPQLVASPQLIQTIQTTLVVGAIPYSIGLTQKLCNDNKIGGLRFGLHAMIQVIGAYTTLYLMLSTSGLSIA